MHFNTHSLLVLTMSLLIWTCWGNSPSAAATPWRNIWSNVIFSLFTSICSFWKTKSVQMNSLRKIFSSQDDWSLGLFTNCCWVFSCKNNLCNLCASQYIISPKVHLSTLNGIHYQSTTFTQVQSEWVPDGFGLIPWTSHSVKDNTITILEMKGKH